MDAVFNKMMKSNLLAMFTVCVATSALGCISAGELSRSIPQSALPKTLELSEANTAMQGKSEQQVDSVNETGRDSDFIGLTQDAAESLAERRGIPHRVVSNDGKALGQTMDYCPGRINFSLEKRKVVQTTRY